MASNILKKFGLISLSRPHWVEEIEQDLENHREKYSQELIDPDNFDSFIEILKSDDNELIKKTVLDMDQRKVLLAVVPILAYQGYIEEFSFMSNLRDIFLGILFFLKKLISEKKLDSIDWRHLLDPSYNLDNNEVIVDAFIYELLLEENDKDTCLELIRILRETDQFHCGNKSLIAAATRKEKEVKIAALKAIQEAECFPLTDSEKMLKFIVSKMRYYDSDVKKEIIKTFQHLILDRHVPNSSKVILVKLLVKMLNFKDTETNELALESLEYIATKNEKFKGWRAYQIHPRDSEKGFKLGKLKKPLKEADFFDYLCKILILGNNSLSAKFLELIGVEKTSSTIQLSSLGVEMYIKNADFKNKTVKTVITKLNVDSKFDYIIPVYFENISTIIIFTDLESENSIKNTKKQLELIGENKKSAQITLIGIQKTKMLESSNVEFTQKELYIELENFIEDFGEKYQNLEINENIIIENFNEELVKIYIKILESNSRLFRELN